MSPRVSVIMPFRNMESYIEQSIRSVVQQTWQDWELLLIDDGSTDDGFEIASTYAAGDPSRIRLLTHPDGQSHGASAARNVGLGHVRGELVALLDADDVWPPNTLEEQVTALEARPDVGVVYGRTRLWYSWTGVPADQRRDVVLHLGVRPGHPIDGSRLLELCLRNAATLPATNSLLIRRDVLARAGGFEEEFTHVHTDQAFYAKLFLTTTLLPVDRCWAWYRRRPDSSSSLSPAEEQARRLRYLDWLRQYLESRNRRGDRLYRAVLREIRWTGRPQFIRRMRRFVHRIPGRVARIWRALA